MLYFSIALFSTGLLVVQFVLSFIISDLDLDTDIDIDADGIGDFSMSDVVSFKGLLHFLVGFSWTMWFSKDENQFIAACIAVAVGILFMLILGLAYKWAKTFEHRIQPEEGKDLIGRKIEIYLKSGDYCYLGYTEINGSQREIKVYSQRSVNYNIGDTTKIIDFYDGKYFIN